MSTNYTVSHLNIISDSVDGEAVIIDLVDGNYFSLNLSASVIWSGIEKQYATIDIIQLVQESFGLNQEQAARAVDTLLSTLHAEKLITPTTEPRATIPPVMGVTEVFTIPEIKKFEDLQEMLMADPIHDVETQGWPHIKNEQ